MTRDKNKAILALEDGTVYHGYAFGAETTVVGELCFNTSMTGYQEILTDPSYKGQIVAMTYPLIGNYGVNYQDTESWKPHANGFVIRELSSVYSSWRADYSLSEYLSLYGVPGIEGIDTRSLTKKLRVQGALKGTLSNEGLSEAEAIEKARQWGGLVGADYVQEVTRAEPFLWDPEETDSKVFRLRRGNPDVEPATDDDVPLPPAKTPILAYDFGVKYNSLRRLRQQGFNVHVVPATTTVETVKRYNPAGIFLSNGPGDPAALDYAVETVRELIQWGVPILAICLGHQILARALGGTTYKLKFGHHGANQPVKFLESGRVEITSQNHGFAVGADSLPDSVSVNRINLNDRTVEGMRHMQKPVISVQYHPEASPGPHDSSGLFEDFRDLVKQKGG